MNGPAQPILLRTIGPTGISPAIALATTSSHPMTGPAQPILLRTIGPARNRVIGRSVRPIVRGAIVQGTTIGSHRIVSNPQHPIVRTMPRHARIVPIIHPLIGTLIARTLIARTTLDRITIVRITIVPTPIGPTGSHPPLGRNARRRTIVRSALLLPR